MCDVCCGERKLLTGDLCVCGDGTQHGLLTAVRTMLHEKEEEVGRKMESIHLQNQLLKKVHAWIEEAGFDGQGAVLKHRIEQLLWPMGGL